jgi:hypothetical protein
LNKILLHQVSDLKVDDIVFHKKRKLFGIIKSEYVTNQDDHDDYYVAKVMLEPVTNDDNGYLKSTVKANENVIDILRDSKTYKMECNWYVHHLVKVPNNNEKGVFIIKLKYES